MGENLGRWDVAFLGNSTILCRLMLGQILSSPTFSSSHILFVNRGKKSFLPHGNVFRITCFGVLECHGKGDELFLSAKYRGVLPKPIAAQERPFLRFCKWVGT